MLKFPAENAEKRGAFVVGYSILRISALSARQKKKKCCVLKFPTENAEKRGAFDAGYSILRHSARSAGQKKEMLCAKVSHRKRRKTWSFCCWLFNIANLCAISETKKEMLCAKFSRRKRRKTWSFCCWLFDSATLCEVSRAKKKKCCVLNFPTENAEKRGAFVVGYSILRHSAKTAGQKKEMLCAKFSRRKRRKTRSF